MKEWVPRIAGDEKPLYKAIVDALANDIRTGQVAHGTQLAPQRELAEQLNISVGTVSRAYAEAERLGYVTAGVGRGTFVNSRKRPAHGAPVKSWNFALNAPPKTGEDELIGQHLVEIGQDAGLSGLLGYLPHAGHPDHCAALAPVLNSVGLKAGERDLILTPGAQHGLDIALRLVCPEGAPIATEAFTFSGLTAIAALSKHELIGVPLDNDGIVPEALDEVLPRSGASVLYATPTLQTPTGTVMSQQRRERIATILQNHKVWLVEDDAYAFLPETPVTPISALIPDQSFYLTSFSKSLTPGLRLGALVPPRQFREKAAMAMRATGWMAVPIMAELVTRLVRSGDFDRQVRAKRRVAAQRAKLARDIMGDLIPHVSTAPGYHVWVEPPDSSQMLSILNQANANGITMAPPLAAKMPDPARPGLRLCLGGFESEADLTSALEVVERLVRSVTDMSYV